MHKRAAFTLVEMLVSMALILFVMVILSTAFTTGLSSGKGKLRLRYPTVGGNVCPSFAS